MIIYTATVERVREYGVLKAVGAKNWQLYLLVSQQALVTALIGVTLGIGLTWLVGDWITATWPEFLVIIQPDATLATVAVGLLMGLLAALLPAQYQLPHAGLGRHPTLDPSADFLSSTNSGIRPIKLPDDLTECYEALQLLPFLHFVRYENTRWSFSTCLQSQELMMSIKQLFIISSLILTTTLVGACGSSLPAVRVDSKAASSDHQAEESDHDEETGDHHANEADSHVEEIDEHHADEIDHAHAEEPSTYQAMNNPLTNSTEAITAGKEIYDANCASCHGPQGKGDGPAAAALDPQPASLANAAMMQDMSDGYLFWRISEGGIIEPFNSAMPAWGQTLSEQEIWQVISYVRTLSGDRPAMPQAEDQHGKGDTTGGAEGEPHAEESDHHAEEAEHHE